ncbi:TPA: hypothetical protein ACH3X1_004911 [Trebouxia sp. C0004]
MEVQHHTEAYQVVDATAKLSRTPDTLSEYWDEVAAEQAVQATQPLTGSDSGLAPGSQSGPATRRGGTDRGSLRPVTGKLHRKR